MIAMNVPARCMKKSSREWRRHLVSVVSVCLFAIAPTIAYAYVWTGGGGNGNWTNPENWGGGGYPKSSSDTAEFTSSVTVTLDKNETFTVGIIKVSANCSVTMNGIDGSVLNPYKSAAIDGNGFVVGAGGRLVVNVPVVSQGRIDKWQPGEVVFNENVTISGNNYFLVDSGIVTVQGTATMNVAEGTLGLGNSLDRKPILFNVLDSARVIAREIQTIVANNGSTGSGRIVQNGENSKVSVSGNLILSGASGTTDKGVYELLAGTLQVGGSVSLGKSGSGTFGGGSFVQSGGRADMTGNITAVRSDESAIVLSGGVLAFSNTAYYFTIGAPLNLSGSPTIELTNAKGYVWLPPKTSFAENTDLTLKGGASFFANTDLITAGELTVDGTSFLVGDPYNSNSVELRAQSGDDSAWPVQLKNGGRLQVSLSNKRVTRPLALNIETGGNVRFVYVDGENPLYARSLLVAHSLVVDGVVKGKGRYTKDNLPGLFSTDSAALASVVVPYVWTGAGDGSNWNDPKNWEGDAVPPSSGSVSVDISRAAGKTLSLDSDTTLSCLVFNPQGDAKSVTISGSGKIIHDCPNFMVGLSVGPEREVVFDVDVVKPAFGQTSYNSPVIVGGGRVVVKKNFPGTTKDDTGSYKRPAYVIDGELAFAGTTRFVSEDSNSLFGIGTWEIAGKSRILFEDGCSVDAWRMDPSPVRNVVSSDEWIQNGGSVSLMNLYFTSYYSKRRTPFSYTLNGGNMTVQGELCVGSAYYTAETRYPGGDFVMNGGTLTLGEFRCQRNDNYIRLNGGDVFLRNGFVDTVSGAQAMTNDTALYIGGATIHSLAAWTSALQAEFTGNATFDTAGFDATFNKPVNGTGGFVKTGAGVLTFADAATFTGPVAVNGGTVVFGSSVTGPKQFTVSSGTLSFRGETANFDTLDIVSGGKISVDCERLVVRKITFNGRERGAGSYNASKGYVGSWLAGTGELVILEGKGPGFQMTVR